MSPATYKFGRPDWASRSLPLPLLLLLLLLLLPRALPFVHSSAWVNPSARVQRRLQIIMGSSSTPSPCGLGFDFGTSGVRINVLETARRGVVFEAAQPWPHRKAVEVRRHKHSHSSAWEGPIGIFSSWLIDIHGYFTPPLSIC